MSSFTLSCESDFPVIGMQKGEDYLTVFRVIATFFAASITSAWFRSTAIKRLSLFFAHWLSGLVLCLGHEVEDMMVSVCWTGSNTEGFVKTLKFFELAATNMMATTNLVICVNLALIVMSHRNATRVKSVSSPGLLLACLLVSMGAAAAPVPFWEQEVVRGTGFWFLNSDEREDKFVGVSMFFMEFIAGACMFVVVLWLLLFWTEEVKESWRIHVRIRYYLGLTLLGTVVHLARGICGAIFVSIKEPDTRIMAWSWLLRYIHIALAATILYGVLGKNIDERIRRPCLRNNMPSGRQLPP